MPAAKSFRFTLLGVLTALAMMITYSRGQAPAVREVIPTTAPLSPARAAVIEQTKPEVALVGRVLRTKLVDVRGSTEKVLAALLELANGQRQIVELGPDSIFKNHPVVPGEQLAARGQRILLGDHDVLLATHVAFGDQKIVIERDVPVAGGVTVAAPTGYSVTEPVVKLQARVARLRKSRLRGSPQEHLVAEMVDRGGRAIVVDLGDPSQLWEADIKQGEWITVRGQEMNVNNRPVLLALEVNKNGVPFLIDRDLVHDQIKDVTEPAPAVVKPTTVVTPSAIVPPATVIERPVPVVERTTVIERPVVPAPLP